MTGRILLALVVSSLVPAVLRAQLPPDYQLDRDWLIDSSPFKARVERVPERNEIVLTNGLVRRVFRLKPNAGTVAFDNLMTSQAVIRATQPEARMTIDGKEFAVGGLTGQPDRAYLTEKWVEKLKPFKNAMVFVSLETGVPKERLKWKRTRHHAPGVKWPPTGVYLRLDFVPPASAGKKASGIRVSVHYELYDGIPALSKWITVQNGTTKPINVDRFRAEELSVVEYANSVETRDGVPLPKPRVLHVETDMAFGGFTYRNANRHAVHWRTEPQYRTQVSYLRRLPCRLVVEPTYGPDQTIPPGGLFESFRVFELVHDSTDRERRGFELKRMYRTVAPWITENPLMLHVRTTKREDVIKAIDQCAEVGFELLILSFGSGFNAENDRPEYLKRWKEIADYARSKGIQMGCYSLLSSRRVNKEDMIVCPPGQKPTHGRCPALASKWGLEYFRKLRNLFEKTGFAVLEHDGPYPGDVDVTPRPPLQKGVNDSRWVQWRISTDFYKWLRARGIYLNAPDYYYLSGSNKCGMGYRETNWSLPRAFQVIHTRQNIYDGTWEKTPSMGWMFVPLTQYHGGGAAATVEPLDQHRDHYERMLYSNLAMGVQACYRGPRLYDTERTKALVKRWVAWFKTYRDILESDVVHGRRADGRDLDWMLHVTPRLKQKGMLVVFNPLKSAREKTIRVNLYYTGLTDRARISERGADPKEYRLDRNYCVEIPVRVEAQGMNWFVIE